MLSLMVSGVLALFALVHPAPSPQPAASISTSAVTAGRRPPTSVQLQAAAHDLENFRGGSAGLVVLVVLVAAVAVLAAVPR